MFFSLQSQSPKEGRPILVDFGVKIDIGHTRVTFGKIQYDGGRHLGFAFLCHISVADANVCQIWYVDIDIGHTRFTGLKIALSVG